MDGVPLVDLVSVFEADSGYDVPGAYAGLARDWEFDAERWCPSPERFLRANLLGCDCGEAGCWPLVARIRAVRDQVIWDSFEQPFRPERDYTGLGPFTFDAGQYAAALVDPRGRRSG
ncbi:hypothetical protein [Klenkia sesuvii]|uniref:hypothetical protein n=1 Tax=Klenkia sesuvii TaxID=3103137 RepID=UPI00300FBD85